MTNPHQQIIAHIKDALERGVPKETIYKTLLEDGWTVETIQEGFETLEEEATKGEPRRRAVHLILMIGAVLVGLGVFFVVVSRWESLSHAMKLIIILTALLASYSSGWYLKEKTSLQTTGEAFVLLGAIIYGLGIFLVPRMFGIHLNLPDGFVLWMVGTVLMAFAIDSFNLFFLAFFAGTTAALGYFAVLPDEYIDTPLPSLAGPLAAGLIALATGWLLYRQSPAGGEAQLT